MSPFEYHIDPAVAAFKASIIPDVTEQRESIQRLIDAVARTGRELTPTETAALRALREASIALWTVQNCANEEVI